MRVMESDIMDATVSISSNNNNNDEPTTNQKRKKRWSRFLGASNHRDNTNIIKDIFLHGTNEKIVDYVKEYPECCQYKYSFYSRGCKIFPLFMVIKRHNIVVDIETIQVIYEAYPKAINGSLHYFLSQQQHRHDKQIISSSSSTSKSPYRPSSSRSNKNDLEILKFLIAKHPDGAKSKQNGYLPLHLALSSASSSDRAVSYDMIHYLIECNPESLQESIQFHLPLHIAIKFGCSLPIIQLLVSKYPEALKIVNYEVSKEIYEEDGWIVKKGKFSFFRNSNTDKSKNSSSSNNIALNTNYFDCGLPIHIACSVGTSIKCLKFLVHEYRESLRVKNYAGYLPIHVACVDGGVTPIEVIDYLVSACPQSIVQRTTLDHYYPVDLCTLSYCPNLSIIRYLISCHPQILYNTTTTTTANKNKDNKQQDVDTEVNQQKQSKSKNDAASGSSGTVLESLFSHYLLLAKNNISSLSLSSDIETDNNNNAFSSLPYNNSNVRVIEFLENIVKQAPHGYSYVSTIEI